MALCMSCEPCTPQQRCVRLPFRKLPVHTTRWAGLTPAASSASAVAGLNVDPGGKVPLIALSSSGLRS